MPVLDNGARDQYTATAAQTVFPYTFEILEKEDIAVEVDGVLKAEGADYTVSGVGNDSGGNITFLVGRTAGEVITIYRNMELKREQDYQQSGDFLADEIDSDFDRLWLALSQEKTKSDLSIRAPLGDSILTSSNTILPAAASRAGKVVSFDSSGALAYISSTLPSGSLSEVDNKAALEALSSPSVGDVAIVKDRASAFFDAVLTSGVTPNGYDIIQSTADPSISWVLRPDGVILPEHFGAVADNSTIVTNELQAYADYCIANKLQFTWGRSAPGSAYRITSPIKFSEPCNITSIGKAKGVLLCDGCSGIEYTGSSSKPSNVTIEKTYIAQLVRHTTTPNSFFAIKFAGTTSSRPFWNTIKNCFIDGFGTPIDWNWVWSSTVTDVRTVFCGKAINAVGKSVNNHIYQNEFSGNGILIDMGDGVESMEGWHISHNLFDGLSLGAAIDAVGAGFCYFHDNICDFMGPVAAVLVRSSGTLAPTGWDIHDNYIAFSAAGLAGVRLLNNVVPGATNKGHTVKDNRIFAYPTHSVTRGIFTDGTEEENNIISGNKVEATLGDCDIAGALNTQVINNKWLGAGFATTANCIYDNNEGTVITSEAFLTRKFGKTTQYKGSAQPSSGSYVIGDEVLNTSPSRDGNNMTLIGWKRLTTGSGHVSGTDWANMYVSHVTPAT